MSWVQWQGETWPSTDDLISLFVHVTAPDQEGPRTRWALDLTHGVPPLPGSTGNTRWSQYLCFELPELGFHENDWRRLAGYEVRADAHWQAAHEYSDAYGNLTQSELSVSAYRVVNDKPQAYDETGPLQWVGLDFILRFGQRDRLRFPLELDGWLTRPEQLRREQAESPAELAQFATTPPNFRLITQAIFEGGQVDVPRSPDPVPWARRLITENIGLTEFTTGKPHWDNRRSLDGKTYTPVVGGRSTVNFQPQG